MKKKWFIICFLLSLFGPTAVYPLVKGRLDQTNYENRQLAEFPDLSADGWEQFPSQFEAWYNDHVPFKNLFVRAKTKLDLKLLGQSAVSSVTVGKENWMFYTTSLEGEDALADYRRENLYTEAEVEALEASIRAAKEEIEGRGMRFFLFEAPNKETIYGEYMPDSIRQFDGPSRLEAVIPRLREEGLPVYDLTEALRTEKEWMTENGAGQDALYYKYDTHWNQLGAFAGSQEMARILLGERTALSEVSYVREANCSGDMARMLNLSEEYVDDWIYRIDDYLPEVTVECVDGTPAGEFSVFVSDSPNDRTLLLVGDSYSQGIKPYLAKRYRRSIFITIETYEKTMLDQYPADDFVYLTVERNQDRFEKVGEILEKTEADRGIKQTADGVKK